MECINVGTANSTRLLGHNLSRKAGAQKEQESKAPKEQIDLYKYWHSQQHATFRAQPKKSKGLLGHNLFRKSGAQKRAK
jgi:hypothetical protein